MTNRFPKMRNYSDSVARNDPKGAAALNDAFGSYGGLMTNGGKPDPLLRWYRLRYWDYLTKYATYVEFLENGYFDYIDNEGLNAMAAIHDGIPLIGINQGTIFNASTFFYLLLSHPDVFPSVGDSKREARWVKSLSRCDWTLPLSKVILSIERKGNIPSDWPLDPNRKAFAAYLSTFALDFLFFHEIGHIINRHIEYDLARGNQIIHEAVSQSSLSTSLDDRALELNADSFAVGITLQPWLDDELPIGQDKENIFSTPDEALVAWTLACGFLFLLFDPHPHTVSAYSNCTHPHPAVRLTNVFMTACQMAKKRSEGTLERIEKAWEGAFKAFGDISGNLEIPTSLWFAVESSGNDVIREYEKLGRHLQKLFPELAQFGIVGWQLFPII